jgi:hypothetical protein
MEDGDYCNAAEDTEIGVCDQQIPTHQSLGKVVEVALLSHLTLLEFRLNTEWTTRVFNFRKATGAVFLNELDIKVCCTSCAPLTPLAIFTVR